MASVFRVKRRIDEDPAEALRLSCKRLRLRNSHSHADGKDSKVSDDSDKTKTKDTSCKTNTSDVVKENSSDNSSAHEIDSVLSFAGTISTKVGSKILSSVSL